MTIYNEQLTIVVSLRDGFKQMIQNIPKGDTFIVNCQLSIDIIPSLSNSNGSLFVGAAPWLRMFSPARMHIFIYSPIIYAIYEKISIFLKISFIFPLTIHVFGCIVNQNSLHRWSTKVRTEKTKGRK